MIQEVKYNRAVKASAMSKSPSQSGLHMNDEHWSKNNTISLHSMNTKDGKVTSHLMLQIPREALESVINALKQFV